MEWDLLDFAVFGALVVAVAGVFILAVRKTRNVAYRAAAGIAMAAAFFLVWVNGAVGLIGDEGNDANMLYGAVIAVGVIGALISRLEWAVTFPRRPIRTTRPAPGSVTTRSRPSSSWILSSAAKRTRLSGALRAA